MYSLRHHLFSPRAPIATGMTTTLTFQTFCNSIIKTWHLPIFSCSLMAMFRSPEIAKSTIWHSILLVDTNYVWWPNLYKFICLNIEIPKDFIFVISLDWLWFVCVCVCLCVCVCVCICVCLYHLLLHWKWCFLRITQQQVYVGLNLAMTFSILTFNQNWTRNNVCYALSFRYRVYIVEYRLSYKLNIWWH